MKVAIVGTVGVPACYGGFETLVENLLDYKSNDDIQYTIYCSGRQYKERPSTYKGARLKYLPISANGIQAMPYDSLSLLDAFRYADIVLWLGPSDALTLPLLKTLFPRKKVIINIDGLDHKRAKFNSLKQKMLGVARKLATRYADVIVSDNAAIVDAVTKLYNRDSELIEYGGDNAFAVPDPDGSQLKRFHLTPHQYTFKVARIEPENNIELILEAFSKMPEQQLVIVGNWDRSEFGRSMKQKYAVYPNLHLIGPIYDPATLNLLRSNCRLYVHGHSVGGTNPSLVEAMSLGLPIAAFDVVFNRATTEEKAVYFSSPDQLRQLVEQLSADKLAELGQTMGEIAKRRYQWSHIVGRYEQLYDSTLQK